MSDDSDLIDEILNDLSTLEEFPSRDWEPERWLKAATQRTVATLAALLESGETVFYSDGEGAFITTDDLVLRFGRAAIKRLAQCGEPNKAFGFTKMNPGNKGNPIKERVQALFIGAFVERERRKKRGIEASIDRAAARYRVSKGTARNRLSLLTADIQGCSTLGERLEDFFKEATTEELADILSGKG